MEGLNARISSSLLEKRLTAFKLLSYGLISYDLLLPDFCNIFMGHHRYYDRW